MVLDLLEFREHDGGILEDVRESQRRRGASVELVDEVVAADEAWARLATLDKSFSRTARGPPAALAAAQPSTNLTRSSSFGRTISRFRTGRVDPTGGGAACREGG